MRISSEWVTRNSADLDPRNGLLEIPRNSCGHFHQIFLGKISGNFRGFSVKLLLGKVLTDVITSYGILGRHIVSLVNQDSMQHTWYIRTPLAYLVYQNFKQYPRTPYSILGILGLPVVIGILGLHTVSLLYWISMQYTHAMLGFHTVQSMDNKESQYFIYLDSMYHLWYLKQFQEYANNMHSKVNRRNYSAIFIVNFLLYFIYFFLKITY